MIKKNIILLTIFLAIVGCGTKKENKESVMDKEIAGAFACTPLQYHSGADKEARFFGV